MTPPPPTRSAPPARAIIAELFAGLVLGAVFAPIFGFGSGLIISWTPWAEQIGMGLLLVMLYVGLLGFGIGAALGIWLVGRRMQQGGSLGLALLGAILSTVLAIALIRIAGFGGNTVLLIAVLVIVPLALALLGYNIRRRPA